MYDLKIRSGNTCELFSNINFERLVEKVQEHSKNNGYTMKTTKSEIKNFKKIIDRGYKKTFTTIDGSELTIKPKRAIK